MRTGICRKALRQPTCLHLLAAPGRAAAALALCLTTLVHAEEIHLGRLFFTPDQRVALERQRYARPPAATEPRPAAEGTVSVDGVVRRSSGKNTVWVNGEPVPDGRSAAGPRPRISGHDPSIVILESGQGRPASVRVGETVDLRSGARDAPPAPPIEPAAARADKSRE